MSSHTREPIISVLGHVDHGKTTFLDYIRGSVVARREAGGITQHIGATDVPFEVVREICGDLMSKVKVTIPIRGLLFIDTPGHEAFTTLRKRGGSVADLAILVVDITEGLQPQTIESIQILKQFKTPFVVAANKVDRINGWRSKILIEEQIDRVKDEFYKKFYTIVAQLSEQGFNSDLYSNIKDFSREVAIVPISGATGEGIPNLLLMLIGLSQHFLKDELEIEVNKPGKGTVLEVKEERGLGTTIDVILYDGTIKRGDTIVVGSRSQPIVTKVKALLRPHSMDEMRDPKEKFKNVDKVYAAYGVKIAAPCLEEAIAGAPLYVGGKELAEQVKNEMGEVEFTRDVIGIVVKADTLGSLEALVKILTDAQIPIRRGTIGKVSKQDVVEASTVRQNNKYLGVIMAFNTPILEESQDFATANQIKIFQNKVIYQLIEDYQKWVFEEKDLDKKLKERISTKPAKFRILPGFTFRQSKPAIVGIEVLEGTLQLNTRLMRYDGKMAGRLKSMQKEKENIQKAGKGDKIAVSIDEVTIGRQLSENDTVYTFIPLDEIQKMKQDELTEEELKLIKEIREIQKTKD
ncbi:MAG: translation initiation factor IF-2 [Candidatus Altiarchaeales archaeon]|nr:translation initiation factor IF-2 [Candidatus Altiarchaeales archaeon]